MNIENTKEAFLDYLARLLRVTSYPFYRTRKEFPIDEALLARNRILGGILFGVAFGVEPERGGFVNDEDYEEAFRLYGLWRDVSLVEAVGFYCHKANDLIEESAREKTTSDFFLLPDISSKKLAIFEELNRLKDPLYLQKDSIMANKIERNRVL